MERMKMKKKYSRAFVPNPNFRFDPTELKNLADEIIYVCDRPMFDNLMGDDHIPSYEGKIAERMMDFNPESDVIAYYGDSIIFALMVMWLSENYTVFDMARFSSKEQTYLVRAMSIDNFSFPARQLIAAVG